MRVMQQVYLLPHRWTVICLCVVVSATVICAQNTGSAQNLLRPPTVRTASVVFKDVDAGSSNVSATVAPVALRFDEFFIVSGGELQLSTKLKNLNRRRIIISGFMAQLENAPMGAFYLCPRPVFADEQAGGTGDIPLESVRVTVRSARGRTVAFVPGALSITGILEVENKEEADGHRTIARLTLDAAPEALTLKTNKLTATPAPSIRRHQHHHQLQKTRSRH